MENKELYHKFCKEVDVPLFMNDWWLDAACGTSGWKALVVFEDPEVRAVFPVPVKKTKGLTVSLIPLLTPYLGPYINYPDKLEPNKKITYEHKIYQRLLEQIPHFHYFEMGFNPQLTNWQAFHWNQFKQTTRYTYLLPQRNLNVNKKTMQRIDKLRPKIQITEKDNLEEVYRLQSNALKRKNKSGILSFAYLKKMDTLLKEKKCRKMMFVEDQKGVVYSGIYLIWDSKFVYQLLLGSDPTYHHLHANSLLVYEAIQFAHNKGLTYNFEGSMIKGVESFIRNFGAIQLPYFYCTKSRSLLFDIYNIILR